MSMIVFFFMFVALASYIFGYNIGRWVTESEIKQKRSEMQLDEEDDGWNELFKS